MSALIAFIESHDGCRVHGMRNGRLIVSILVMAEGRALRMRDDIAPTMRSARDWLGY